MVTDEQLTSAIRSIGGSGEPFSSAALRAFLGISTEDRRALTRFNAALLAYSKRSDSLERIGKNRYRLLESEPILEQPRALRRVVIRITRTPEVVEPEPRVFWLWALCAKLGLSIGLGGAR